VNIMEDEPKLPLHNVFRENVAVNCKLFLNANNVVRTGVVHRLTFENNLSFGPIDKRDVMAFPQTDEGKRRVTFLETPLPDSVDPDTNGFRIQDSGEFKRLAPWFKRISLERIGPEKKN